MYTEGGRGVPKENDPEEVIHLDLGNLLSFISGAAHPPPLGFSIKPLIEFTDDPNAVLPRASTCLPALYISLHLTDYNVFKNAFDMAIYYISTWLWNSLGGTKSSENCVVFIMCMPHDAFLILLVQC